jgi:flagellar motor switch protein FliN/FliY
MKTTAKTGRIEEIRVPIQVVLGETELRLEQLAGIGEGTIVTLDSFAGEPVRVLASGEQIAWGEVVVCDENFGIRITQILGKERRPE